MLDFGITIFFHAQGIKNRGSLTFLNYYFQFIHVNKFNNFTFWLLCLRIFTSMYLKFY